MKGVGTRMHNIVMAEEALNFWGASAVEHSVIERKKVE